MGVPGEEPGAFWFFIIWQCRAIIATDIMEEALIED